jgi:hypothetical protein
MLANDMLFLQFFICDESVVHLRVAASLIGCIFFTAATGLFWHRPGSLLYFSLRVFDADDNGRTDTANDKQAKGDQGGGTRTGAKCAQDGAGERSGFQIFECLQGGLLGFLIERKTHFQCLH